LRVEVDGLFHPNIQVLVMVDKCDICRFDIGPDSRYCGKCGVDLRELKGSEGSPGMSKILDEMQDFIKSISMSEKPKHEDVINWCEILAICKSFKMDFPTYLMLAIMLAKGDKYLGFCDCHVCNQGYRQLLAELAKSKDGEAAKLTAQSRDVIIKARRTEINGLSFDISRSKNKEKKTEQTSHMERQSSSGKSSGGMISIEVDPEVLEGIVIRVLKSESGREIIQSVLRKYTKKKKVD
jgi:hypothetical protein